MRLFFVKEMITIIQKPSARLIIFGFLFLPVVFLPNLSSAAPDTLGNLIRNGVEPLTSLAAPGLLTSEIELAKGRFLVASDRLYDPSFRETVVLLMRYGLEGAAGLVINRPLGIKLATVLPDFKDSAHGDKALYLGGPVEPTKMLLLEKAAKPPPDSMPVFGDVYISSSRAELQRLIKSTDKDDKFKIFAGYAGWAPGQLEAECDRGDWHVLKADAATVFDKKSSEIWPELIHRFMVNWVRTQNSGQPRLKRKPSIGKKRTARFRVVPGTMTFGEAWGWGAYKDENRRIFDAFAEDANTFSTIGIHRY